MKQIANLAGQRFGRLFVDQLQRKGKKIHWLCICDCGNTVAVLGANLKNGHTRSCGCLQKEKASANFKDLTGIVFGRLTVLNIVAQKNRNYTWSCLCQCGENTIVASSKLISGHTQSCGCLWRDTITKHGMHGKPGYTALLLKDPVRKLKRYIGNRIRETMKDRDLLKDGNIFDYLPYTAMDLVQHLESQWESWMNWDNYGGTMNDPKRTWHIDHIVAQVHFKYTSMSDPAFRECWALSNLRPLEKIANCRKRCGSA